MLQRSWILVAALFGLSLTASPASAFWDGHLAPGCGTPCATTAPCPSCAQSGSVCEKCRPNLLKGLSLRVHTGGTETPVGCGCLAAQKTFILGSCNQFFHPTKKCGGCLLGGRGCATGAAGCGVGGQHPCAYGSYLNR